MPHCPACYSAVPADSTKCESCGAPYFSPDLGILESRISPEAEAELKMPSFVPISVGLLGVSGAAWGLLAIASQLSSSSLGIATTVIVAAAASLYAFGGYAGVKAIRRSAGWLRVNFVFWCLQVPALSSPLLTYMFFSGGHVTPWIQLFPPVHMGLGFFLGSSFKLSLFARDEPIVFGVNLVALAISLFLLRLQRPRDA